MAATLSSKEHETSLRQELKAWEKAFAVSSGGKHPSRQDIKNDPAIARKYKDYNALRALPSHPIDPPTSPSKKRKLADITLASQHPPRVTATPKKHHRPRLHHQELADGDKENAHEELPAFIGPTPQKDGRVLGLFDTFSEGPDTPSKLASTRTHPGSDGTTVEAIQATPRKGQPSSDLLVLPSIAGMANTPTTINKHSRTPQSLGKRFLLDSFLTPSKRRRLDEQGTPTSSARHVQTSTPAFLSRCRAVLPLIAEDDNDHDFGQDDTHIPPTCRRGLPRPANKRRSFTRSLSSMIKDLRQNEDDRLDEDMDLLRELEDEASAPLRPEVKPTEILVEDSQCLGPDGTNDMSEDEADATSALGRDGKSLKVWKKKGQKRTTKRVHMKPQPRKRPLDPVPEVDSEEEQEETTTKHTSSADAVAESQHGSLSHDQDNDSQDDDADSDANFSADESKVDTERPAKKPKPSKKDTGMDAILAAHVQAPKQGMMDKVAKKISATAHANFCRLKIKSSKGAKAATAGGGRFGRGRFGKGRR